MQLLSRIFLLFDLHPLPIIGAIYICAICDFLYSPTSEIGKGEFGTVWRGKWTIPEGGTRTVAIKLLNPDLPRKDRIRFLQEAVILGQFRHPNIVNLFGVVKDGEPVSVLSVNKATTCMALVLSRLVGMHNITTCLLHQQCLCLRLLLYMYCKFVATWPQCCNRVVRRMLIA